MAANSYRYAFITADLPDIEVTFPGVAAGPGVGSSFGVLKFGDLEVELNDSKVELLPEYFTAGSAIPEGEFTLASGLPVVFGRVNSQDGGGYRFGVKAGRRCLLGSVPQTVPLDTLAAWLADLQIAVTATGLKVTPGKARWSEVRTPNVVVGVTLRSGRSSLLDIRPAYRGVAQSRAGLRVEGGYLSRQGQSNQPERLVLNAEKHVVYILASSDEALDEVAELGSGVTVRSVVS